jgi:hypothetical protein
MEKYTKMSKAVAEWQSGKISIAELCDKYNCTDNSFYYWRSKLQKQNTTAPQFIPINIPNKSEPVNSPTPIKIVYPNKVCILLEDYNNIDLIGHLVKLV